MVQDHGHAPHILVHGYFNIDQDLVWDVVEHDLADLKGKINAILQKLG